MLQQTERQDLLADVGERYRLLLDTINEGIFFHEKGVIYEVNQAMADMTGYPLEDLFSLRIFDIVAPDSRRELVGRMRDEDPGPYEINLRRKDESLFPVEVVARSADVSGRTVRVVIVRDITRQKEHEESIREHSRQVLALSTPIVRIWSGVLLLPLVGVLDDERATHMTSNLLGAIVEDEAHVAIIDVSGTVGMDSSAARHLLSAAAAARLLGAGVILTGLSPEAAQSLAQLGVDFQGITTRGSLQAGVTEALQRVDHGR